MSFLTLEDINTTLYANQNFWWHEINTGLIGDEDFSDIKIDFCKISRVTNGTDYVYTIQIDNNYWANAYYILKSNGDLLILHGDYEIVGDNNVLIITTELSSIRLFLYFGSTAYQYPPQPIYYRCKDDYVNVYYNEIGSPRTFKLTYNSEIYEEEIDSDEKLLEIGINYITYSDTRFFAGFIFVNLIKTDFKFDCNQELLNGKINTVKLGVNADYKPNGDLVGEYTPEISVFYGDETLPVVWNPILNDYTFNIDLTNHEKETDVILTVFVDNNEVLNQISKDIRLHTRFENIDSITKLNTLFQNGGIGRLNTDLILTNDLTVSNDVYLLGNHYNINMAGNKFIISENKTFKCEQTSFNNGENTIQQKLDSKVELTECSFTNCTGLGSVIDCQIDIKSLTNPNDFTTNLEKCVFDSCDMMILHGGKLSVTNCIVNGTNTKVDNPNYPFFLYQTDGTARILQSEFNFIHDTDIDEDIEFNSCIFVCGETAEINGYNHTELQKNNLTQFLEIQRNTSKINVTYYYNPIEDYITLQSNNGFCHAVSNVDYVFKTNVTPQRR